MRQGANIPPGWSSYQVRVFIPPFRLCNSKWSIQRLQGWKDVPKGHVRFTRALLCYLGLKYPIHFIRKSRVHIRNGYAACNVQCGQVYDFVTACGNMTQVSGSLCIIYKQTDRDRQTDVFGWTAWLLNRLQSAEIDKGGAVGLQDDENTQEFCVHEFVRTLKALTKEASVLRGITAVHRFGNICSWESFCGTMVVGSGWSYRYGN